MNSRRYQGYDSKVSLIRVFTCENLQSHIFANIFTVCVFVCVCTLAQHGGQLLGVDSLLQGRWKLKDNTQESVLLPQRVLGIELRSLGMFDNHFYLLLHFFCPMNLACFDAYNSFMFSWGQRPHPIL